MPGLLRPVGADPVRHRRHPRRPAGARRRLRDGHRRPHRRRASPGRPHVVGVDLNEAMLTVARRVRRRHRLPARRRRRPPLRRPLLRRRAVQMALMFFPDRIGGAPGDGPRRGPAGRSRSWSRPRSTPSPPSGPFVDMAARHAGREARSLLSTYFACGDLDELSTSSPRLACADRHRHPSRHGAVPVGGRARNHRGGKHPPAANGSAPRSTTGSSMAPARSSHRSPLPTAPSQRPSKPTSSPPGDKRLQPAVRPPLPAPVRAGLTSPGESSNVTALTRNRKQRCRLSGHATGQSIPARPSTRGAQNRRFICGGDRRQPSGASRPY